MPTYTYKCQDCGAVYEETQSIHDDAFSECRECKGRISRIIPKNVGVQFVGSGFYINDKDSGSSTSTSEST